MSAVQETSSTIRREQELHRVVRAVRALLTAENLEGALEQVLRIVGREAGCERACIFSCEQKGHAQQMRIQAYWSDLQNGKQKTGWEVKGLLPEGQWPSWHERLATGDVIRIQADELPESRRGIFNEQGVQSTLVLPIQVEGGRWGGLRLDACRRPRRWTRGEVDVLSELADDLGSVLARYGATAPTDQAEGAGGAFVLSRVDRVLVDVSRLLVSQRDFAPEELLGLVGEALNASHVYLITIPPDQPLDGTAEGISGALLSSRQSLRERRAATRKGSWPRLDAYTYHEWYAHPDEQRAVEEHTGETPSLAIPILSEAGLLYGYLGVEREATLVQAKREEQVLHVLGNMLATYLERQMAEAAFRASEERYRAFVRTIIEGIWCIEIDPALDTSLPAEEQLTALREHGVVVECNESMAHVLGADDPKEIVGRKAYEVVPDGFDGSFFRDTIALGYELHNREYTLRQEGEPVRHFMVSALGTVEDGRLLRVWGSWTDVTERVELERRMVAALEQQQERIGRELHDGVGQLLTGIRMLGQNMAERHFEAGDEGYERVQKILRFTREAVRLVRELQRGLAPVQVYDSGMIAALDGLAQSTDGLSDIICTFEHDGEADVEEREVRLQLFRIAQEATNNALKHAAPTQIRISFAMEDRRPVLRVQDDGSGFDPTEQADQSLGLHSMQYRARSVGATLTIDAEPGEGTIIRCALPRLFD